jgi:secreted trypsin-like serine protease
MRANLKVSVLLALLAAPVATAPAGAVSGGAALPIEQAPYVVWLNGRCTGTLISPTRILTAGHCLDGSSASDDLLLVGVDGNLLSTAQRDARAIPIAGYSVHPKFKESFPFAHDDPSDAIAVNDVGLILLKKPITTIAPVRVAGVADAALEAPGVQTTLIGYGDTAPPPDIGAPPVHPLQQGTMPVIGASDCAQAFPRAIQPSMGCSEDLARHVPLIQACAGDSGGPVVVSTPAGPVQIGVTSWGPETMNGACGEKFLPDVYMRTAAFTSFINQKRPVIEPFIKRRRDTSGGLGSAVVKVAGTPREGHKLTCKVPKLGGNPYTLSYSWSVTRGVRVVELRGATKQTLEITHSLYRVPKHDRNVACRATARNAGGSISMSAGFVRLKK